MRRALRSAGVARTPRVRSRNSPATAAAPPTWGAACEVPERYVYEDPPSGGEGGEDGEVREEEFADAIRSPGATRSGLMRASSAGPKAEKGATSPEAVPPGRSLPVAPTERTFFAVPGEVTEPAALSRLPAEKTKSRGCTPASGEASAVSAS